MMDELEKGLKRMPWADYEEYPGENGDRKEVVVAGVSDGFYLRPEEDDRCYTDPATMAWLLRQEHIMECLMKCGIHNSDVFEEAMQMHREEWKK